MRAAEEKWMSNTEVILVIVGQTKPQATHKTGNGTGIRSRCRFMRCFATLFLHRHIDSLQVHIHEAGLHA